MANLHRTTLAAALTVLALPADARDLGTGFSILGRVELEHSVNGGDSNTLGFADLALGWRSQGGGTFGFGVDVALEAERGFGGDDYSESELWGALVLTTAYGDLAIGKPLPVTQDMFVPPQVGGSKLAEILFSGLGGREGSFIALTALRQDISVRGMTFEGTSGAFTYGLGVHRLEAGGTEVDAFEVGGLYRLGQTELYAAIERLDIPGGNLEKLQLAARYTTDRWSGGVYFASAEVAPGANVDFTTLFADYAVSDAFILGAQYLNISSGSDDSEAYGVTGAYGFGGGAFAELGLLAEGDGDQIFSASIGYDF